jgi:hypothetical protein
LPEPGRGRGTSRQSTPGTVHRLANSPISSSPAKRL